MTYTVATLEKQYTSVFRTHLVVSKVSKLYRFLCTSDIMLSSYIVIVKTYNIYNC